MLREENALPALMCLVNDPALGEDTNSKIQHILSIYGETAEEPQ